MFKLFPILGAQIVFKILFLIFDDIIGLEFGKCLPDVYQFWYIYFSRIL